MKTISMMFALLRAAACGEELNGTLADDCTQEMLEAVYELSARHDLAHIADCALEKLPIPQWDILSKFRIAKQQAVYRYVRMDHAYEQICRVFEEGEIPFIPLKGTVLRDTYPEPWMRTSCDIDILVHTQDLERAAALLTSSLGFRRGSRTSHDISFFAPGGVCLELHFSVIEEGISEETRQTLSRVWDSAQPVRPGAYRHVIPDPVAYCYHMAHMSKHIQNGGCGIRPFLDVWMLNHRVVADGKERKALLEKVGLYAFGRAAEKLSEIWFSRLPADSQSMRLERYILSGGVYGEDENRIKLNGVIQGSRLRYALSRIFLPYDTIKHYYPVLLKHRFLTPVFQVVRWFRTVFAGKMKRSVWELQYNAKQKETDRSEMHQLLRYLGLSER